jgi:hypothetical protein
MGDLERGSDDHADALAVIGMPQICKGGPHPILRNVAS